MTEENVRLIREGYDAMARGDFEWVKEHAHPEIDQRFAIIFTSHGDKVARMDTYESVEEALKAADASG
jgi:hypothetical protein